MEGREKKSFSSSLFHFRHCHLSVFWALAPSLPTLAVRRRTKRRGREKRDICQASPSSPVLVVERPPLPRPNPVCRSVLFLFLFSLLHLVTFFSSSSLPFHYVPSTSSSFGREGGRVAGEEKFPSPLPPPPPFLPPRG